MSGSVLQRAPQAAADWPGTRQPAEAGRRPWGGGARQPCPCPIPSLDPPPICAPSPISAPRSTPLTSPRCPPVPMYLSPPRGPAPRPQACVTALRPSGPFHPHPAPVSHSCPRPPPRRRPPSPLRSHPVPAPVPTPRPQPRVRPARPAAPGPRGPRCARTCLDLAWAAVGPFLRSTVTVSQSLSAMAGQAALGIRPAAPRQLLETRRRDDP